jgi:hypothetical protein
MPQYRKAFTQVQSAYRAAGAPEAVRWNTHPDGHVMVVAPILEWLRGVAPVPQALPGRAFTSARF